MAKKDKENNNTTISELLSLLPKEDRCFIRSLEDIADDKKEIISVSPTVNMGIGGGIQKGSWVNLSGKWKCGKTSLALKIATEAQKMGMTVVYDNIEHRLQARDLKGSYGFDTSNGIVIESATDKIMSAEKHLNTVSTLLKGKSNLCVIMDSVSTLCTEAEIAAGIGPNARHGGPKLLAQFCRQMQSIVPIQNSIVILIQHLMANVSGYGSPYIEDGGAKIQYQSNYKIRCKSYTKWEESDKQIGQVSKWISDWSSTGAPGVEFQTSIRYGIGVDDIQDVITIGIDLGLIDKAGAWFNFADQKFQGQAKLYEFFKQNTDKYELLLIEVNKILC